MLESVRPNDDGGAEQTEPSQHAEPQPFGARRVDDVVRSVGSDRARDGEGGRDPRERLSSKAILRKRSEVVREKDVARVTERAEFLLQLERDLGGAEPRVAWIVAD